MIHKIITNECRVMGPIGIGKSTFLGAFPKVTQILLPDRWIVSREPVETNPYLDDFYGKGRPKEEQLDAMRRYSPLMECFLVSQKRLLLDEFVKSGHPIASDWGEAAVFCKMLHGTGVVDDRDYKTFKTWLEIADIYVPRAIIYLEGVSYANARLKKRNRECEAGLEETSYNEDLDKEYRKHLEYLSSLGSVVKYLPWPAGGDLLAAQDFLRTMNFPSTLHSLSLAG